MTEQQTRLPTPEEIDAECITIRRPSYSQFLTDEFLMSPAAKQLSGADWRIYLALLNRAVATGAGVGVFPLTITTGDIAKAANIAALSAADLHLNRLLDAGLIIWDKGRKGTTRQIYLLFP